MSKSKPTHTAYFEDGSEFTFSCALAMRIGWANEEAAKRRTRVLRII